MTGDLYVVSGPSGAGKGTLLARIMPKLDNVWLSISATTRKPRIGEKHGVHYFFISDTEFDRLIAQDGLLEWASVHDERYGTLRYEVESRLEKGLDVILEIDPQGAFQVASKIPKAVLVFIEPPSLEVLEQRLRDRGTESSAQIEKRLKNAQAEMLLRDHYQRIITNDDLERASEELFALIKEKEV